MRYLLLLSVLALLPGCMSAEREKEVTKACGKIDAVWLHESDWSEGVGDFTLATVNEDRKVIFVRARHTHVYLDAAKYGRANFFEEKDGKRILHLRTINDILPSAYNSSKNDD